MNASISPIDGINSGINGFKACSKSCSAGVNRPIQSNNCLISFFNPESPFGEGALIQPM